MPSLSSLRPRRILVAIVATLLLALLFLGPLRGLRSDIAQQKRDVHAQRGVVTEQLATMREQLSKTQKQLEITTEQLELARKQGRLTEDLVSMQRQLLESVELQRRLLAIAEETLRVLKEINRKLPGVTA